MGLIDKTRILLKSNATQADAVPTTSEIEEKEVAANLLDRSLFGRVGSSVFRFYEHPTKYFNSQGQANDAAKLGGQSSDYFASAAALETLRELVNNMGSANISNLATKEEVIDNEQVIALAFNKIREEIEFERQNLPINYYNKEQTNTEIARVINEIILNEEVIAGAVNDLRALVKDLQKQVKSLKKTE